MNRRAMACRRTANWRCRDWLEPFLAAWREPLDTAAARMRLAVALAAENVRQRDRRALRRHRGRGPQRPAASAPASTW